MTKIDYDKIGFRCGIEIHQQLETRKLFCDCPSIVHDLNPDIKVTRRLRAVVGETGEVDVAAAKEALKGKQHVYEGCSTSCCLVELDEEPPHAVNPEALKIAVMIAGLFNAKLVDEIQFMRKIVVDGSNVSGFQRTGLVALDGYIDTSLGKVSIPLIALEEEAAKRVKEDAESITWRLDRLGVPLVEVSTGPDIKSPLHAKEVAKQIGMILRSTGKVKRGIGTIRQDVNVSVLDGSRVEIKGFQDLRSIPDVIENEILRQQEMIGEKKKVSPEVRAANPDGTTRYLRPMPGAARLYPETDVIAIRTKGIKAEAVDLIDEKIKRYEALGLKNDLATLMADKRSELFEELVGCMSLKPTFIAETIFPKLKEISRKESLDALSIPDEKLKEMLLAVDKGVSKDAVDKMIITLAKGKDIDYSKYAQMDDSKLDKIIDAVIADNKGASAGALMGKAMAVLKGRADGKKVLSVIKRKIIK